MSRIARIVGVGLPHYVIQRGNYAQDIFLHDEDYARYLSWIEEYSLKYHLSILGFCLLPKEVHFIVIPRNKNALSKTFNIAHMCYAQYRNKQMKGNGHLWQGRFYSCILDTVYVPIAIKHIEKCPERLNLVEHPWEWKWSSALAHTEGISSLFALDDIGLITGMSPSVWKQYLASRERENLVAKVKRSIVTGRPVGNEEFINNLEQKLNRSLRVLPRGRPRKTVPAFSSPGTDTKE